MQHLFPKFFRRLAFAIVPCLLTLTGCSHQPTAASEDAPEQETAVSIVHPVRRTVRYTVEQPGRVEPFEQTPVYTKIAGFVRSVGVSIGDRVKKGDVLVDLDVPELVEAHRGKEAMVAQARLGVVQAERLIDVVRSSLTTCQADLDVAQAARERTTAALKRWESESTRMARLVHDKIIDNQSDDEVRNQYRAAAAADKEAAARIRGSQASMQEAKARLAKSEADLDAARNQSAVAAAAEREAKAVLGYAQLRSPFDGVISDRQVHTGHFLNAATGSTTGQPLLVVVRTDKVRVIVDVPEADAVRVLVGSPGRVRVQTLNDREFEGTVAGTSWSLDRTQRTLRTEIDFSNPNGLLRPGMYVHSLIEVEHPDAWMIPASAVLIRDGQSFCYEVRNGKTRRLPVHLGLRDGKSVEITKVQAPVRVPGDLPTWMNPTGQEEIVATKPGELIDNQEVRVAENPVPADASRGAKPHHDRGSK